MNKLKIKMPLTNLLSNNPNIRNPTCRKPKSNALKNSLTVAKNVLSVKELVKLKSMEDNNRLKIKSKMLLLILIGDTLTSLDLIKMDMISMDSIIKVIIEMG